MCRKSKFTTQRCAILFTRTTTLILPDQASKFFELSSTPNPFSLVATPLLNLVVASP
jgi:hypothetical protein